MALVEPVIIGMDDPEAICTPSGWRRYLDEGVERSERLGQGPPPSTDRLFALGPVDGDVVHVWAPRWLEARAFAIMVFGDHVKASPVSGLNPGLVLAAVRLKRGLRARVEFAPSAGRSFAHGFTSSWAHWSDFVKAARLP